MTDATTLLLIWTAACWFGAAFAVGAGALEHHHEHQHNRLDHDDRGGT